MKMNQAKKLYQSLQQEKAFFVTNKGEQKWATRVGRGEEEKFSVPGCSRRMLPTDEKISSRLVVISENRRRRQTLFLSTSVATISLSFFFFLVFVMLMCVCVCVCVSEREREREGVCVYNLRVKKVKKAKTRKREERAFSGLKSAKTGLAQLRSAENQFHILILSHSHSLSLIFLSLSPFSRTFGVSLHLGHASPSITNQGLLEGTQIFFQQAHFSARFNVQCTPESLTAPLCIGPPGCDVTGVGGA